MGVVDPMSHYVYKQIAYHIFFYMASSLESRSKLNELCSNKTRELGIMDFSGKACAGEACAGGMSKQIRKNRFNKKK